jgi:hypothetical protein
MFGSQIPRTWIIDIPPQTPLYYLTCIFFKSGTDKLFSIGELNLSDIGVGRVAPDM